MESPKEWRALIRKLRKHFPVEQPVKVLRRAVGPKAAIGLTTFNGTAYRIRIKSNQDWQSQVDSLLHEFAHILAIEEAFGHQERWPVLYGKIYDAWTKDFVK